MFIRKLKAKTKITGAGVHVGPGHGLVAQDAGAVHAGVLRAEGRGAQSADPHLKAEKERVTLLKFRKCFVYTYFHWGRQGETLHPNSPITLAKATE